MWTCRKITWLFSDDNFHVCVWQMVAHWGPGIHIASTDTGGQFHQHFMSSFYNPKCAKRQSSHQFIFVLLLPTCVKAARKMLMKLSPNPPYIIIVCADSQSIIICIGNDDSTICTCTGTKAPLHDSPSVQMYKNILSYSYIF